MKGLPAPLYLSFIHQNVLKEREREFWNYLSVSKTFYLNVKSHVANDLKWAVEWMWQSRRRPDVLFTSVASEFFCGNTGEPDKLSENNAHIPSQISWSPKATRTSSRWQLLQPNAPSALWGQRWVSPPSRIDASPHCGVKPGRLSQPLCHIALTSRVEQKPRGCFFGFFLYISTYCHLLVTANIACSSACPLLHPESLPDYIWFLHQKCVLGIIDAADDTTVV